MMFDVLKSLWKDDSGSTAVEYGLIAALVSVAVISTLMVMGTSLGTLFAAVSTHLSSSFTPPVI